jgi:carbohydrate-selective porin OprB
MLWASPGQLWDIGVGVADADGDWENVFDDIFSILELDFKPRIANREGNYRIYGWFNNKDHEDLSDPDETDEDNYGIGLSFDQEVTDVMTLFARYGWQRGSVSQVEHAWSAGSQCSGKFYGREDDTFGLAYGMAIIGDDWEEDVDEPEGIDSGDEHHVELYYNFKANDHLNISPDIQWVKNPNGDSDNDDVWAFGVRAQLSL